jgi:hypothetical protein
MADKLRFLKHEKKFMERAVSGEFGHGTKLVDTLHDAILEWRDSLGSEAACAEAMGMTILELKSWLRDANTVPAIIEARKGAACEATTSSTTRSTGSPRPKTT